MGSKYKKCLYSYVLFYEKESVIFNAEFQDKNGLSVEGEYGTFTFTKVVGPVGKSFKPSLSASGRDGGGYSAQYQGSIEVLKNGKALVGSASGSGSGRVYITCPINE